ncbi:MAG TPA: DnaB-like helicase C-terminal domain-containing protein [Chloroflexota bacterium]|nr:DnaB-like helicase C-terminal domain-containing protein [Chloroflexota bacterium]
MAPTEHLFTAAEEALADLCRDAVGRIGVDEPTAILSDLRTRGRVAHFERTGSTIMGHATGLSRLDDLLGGLEPGRVTILQAAPGTGKTVLSNQIAYHVAAHAGAPVLYLALPEL